MTSTTEVRDEIEALFSWNPLFLIHNASPNAVKTSSHTRPPTFYDMHFSSNLIVKCVKPLPSLVQDLAKNVDKALDAALGTLPSLDTDFITAKQRASDAWHHEVAMTDEKALGEYYGKTTAKYCSFVASMIALHPSFPRWRTLLYWTQSPASSGYAKMDGELRFMSKSTTHDKREIELEAVVNSVDGKVRTIVQGARKSMSSLVTWEMKSIPVGTSEVMSAVCSLGEFTWTFCNGGCKSHVKQQEIANRAVVGHDAQAPPWSLPGENRDEEIGIKPVRRPATRSVTASGSSAQPMKNIDKKRKRDNEEASEFPLSKGKKRNRDDEDYQDRHDMSTSGSSMLPPPTPLLLRGSKDKGKKHNSDEAYKDRDDITAQKLVQQAWAQAVRVDGTIIILHSGNQELVCLRHRQSQTLYVSDPISPPKCSNPGYGKIHVGIYIAAIQDLIDRRQQRPESMPSGDGDDGEDQGDQDDDHGSGSGRKGARGSRGHHNLGKGKGKGKSKGKSRNGGRSRGSVGKKDPVGDELAAVKKAINVASNRNLVLLYLQYDVYDSPIPASFIRSAPSIMGHAGCPTPPFSPRTLHSDEPEECLTIILTSEIGRGATGVVHRGTLKPEVLDDAMPLDVVVKLAFDSEQRDALKSEYEIYRHLKSKGVHQGIATPLGIFDDLEDGACALVLLYAGVPLSKFLGILDCKTALSTLESIHEAGILHGDIRRANILIGDLGVTIIDFGHSKQCDDQEAKDKELTELRYLLRRQGLENSDISVT